MKKLFAITGLMLLSSTPVFAANTSLTVEQRYTRSCAQCHEPGVFNAPKRGDKAAWQARYQKGETVLLKNAKEGIKMMPAMGLCTTCSDADLLALIRYMAK